MGVGRVVVYHWRLVAPIILSLLTMRLFVAPEPGLLWIWYPLTFGIGLVLANRWALLPAAIPALMTILVERPGVGVAVFRGEEGTDALLFLTAVGVHGLFLGALLGAVLRARLGAINAPLLLIRLGRAWEDAGMRREG